MAEHLDWTNAKYADGRKLVEWLVEERHIEYGDGGDLGGINSALGEMWARRIHGWMRQGENAHFWTVDQLMTELGLHVSMIPDHVWTTAKTKRKGVRRAAAA